MLLEDLDDLLEVGVFAAGCWIGMPCGTGGTASDDCEKDNSAALLVVFDLTEEGVSPKSFIFEGILRKLSLEGVFRRLLSDGARFNAFESFLTLDKVSVLLYIVKSKSSSPVAFASISTPSSDNTQ